MKHKRKDRRRSRKAGQHLSGDEGFLQLTGGYNERRISEHDGRRPLDFEPMEDDKRRQFRHGDGRLNTALPVDDDYDERYSDWTDDWADEDLHEWDDD